MVIIVIIVILVIRAVIMVPVIYNGDKDNGSNTKCSYTGTGIRP